MRPRQASATAPTCWPAGPDITGTSPAGASTAGPGRLAPTSTPRSWTATRRALASAENGVGGAFNVAGPPGQVTIGELPATAPAVTGADAELVWAPPELLEEERFPLGMEFGLRHPHDPAPTGIHDADVGAAFAAGLACRSLRDTLAGTWAWLRAEGDPPPRPDAAAPDT
ncbi:hypothetical protein AB0392_29890 [Nonomuraea angiospora]|uniref:hypothetical protein n=1 Tax=Nonomuraea angiospora TaxID=46172 RepID=UPI00344CD9AD